MSLGNVICFVFWRGSYMQPGPNARSWDHHPPLPGSSKSRTDVWPAHHRRRLVCHSLPCNPDNNPTRSHLSISTRPFQRRHYLLQLCFCFVSSCPSIPAGHLNITSYVTTCQNWRSNGCQRRFPVQSFALEHHIHFSFQIFKIQVIESLLKTLKQRKWDVLLSHII